MWMRGVYYVVDNRGEVEKICRTLYYYAKTLLERGETVDCRKTGSIAGTGKMGVRNLGDMKKRWWHLVYS